MKYYEQNYRQDYSLNIVSKRQKIYAWYFSLLTFIIIVALCLFLSPKFLADIALADTATGSEADKVLQKLKDAKNLEANKQENKENLAKTEADQVSPDKVDSGKIESAQAESAQVVPDTQEKDKQAPDTAILAEDPNNFFGKPIGEEHLKRSGEPYQPDLDVRWPVFGQTELDATLNTLIISWVEDFERECSGLGSVTSKPDPTKTNSMQITWESHKIAETTLAIIFNVWTNTGGVHPLHSLESINYYFPNNQILEIQDLFAMLPKALDIFSKIARERLPAQMETVEEELLRLGTEAKKENFSTFALYPNGLRLYFQAYQVAPWSEGSKYIDISLAELAPARPRLEFWQINQEIITTDKDNLTKDSQNSEASSDITNSATISATNATEADKEFTAQDTSSEAKSESKPEIKETKPDSEKDEAKILENQANVNNDNKSSVDSVNNDSKDKE